MIKNDKKTEKEIRKNIELCIRDAANESKVAILKEEVQTSSQEIYIDIKVISKADWKKLIKSIFGFCDKYGLLTYECEEWLEKAYKNGFRGVVLRMHDRKNETPNIELRFSVPILDYAAEIDDILNNLQENKDKIKKREIRDILMYYEEVVGTNRLRKYIKQKEEEDTVILDGIRISRSWYESLCEIRIKDY